MLKKRLDAGLPLAFCLIDLSNFKAFNDRYGYASGSEVIKETARIIEAAVRSQGSPGDFVGHVGGDDFVVLTTPRTMREVADEIIATFDKRIPGFYSKEDRARGYIRGKTRQGAAVRYPIMTVSIAIVTNEKRKLDGPPEVAAIAAEVKARAKAETASACVIDRRSKA